MKRTHHTDLSLTVTFGREGNPAKQPKKVRALAERHRVSTLYVIDPPREPYGPGWHKVATAYELPCTAAEGGVLTRTGEALLVSSRDCPIVIVENRVNGRIGAVHAGRESLITRTSPCCKHLGVIESLLVALQVYDGARTRAYITASIGAGHFTHDEWSWVEPFVKEYGPGVVVDHQRGALDLAAVITAKLERYGIYEVARDGLCTVDTAWLGSRRAAKDGANWVFVMKK